MSTSSTTDAPAEPELVLERQGPVLVVRLNRPDARNALTPSLLSGIGTAVVEAESDPEVRVVVLTGTGDRAFCAGMDLCSFVGGDTPGTRHDAGDAGFMRLLRGEIAVPIVGAANGSAVAGGFELLLGCDVVVASSAARFGLPEVKRGLFAAGGGTFIGTRIPLAVALEIGLTGDSIDATRAYELGLVNSVVAPDEVVATAIALAGRIAANGPLAIAATKELVRLAVTDPARVGERLGELQRTVLTSDDAKEGANAFLERRPPVWTGR